MPRTRTKEGSLETNLAGVETFPDSFSTALGCYFQWKCAYIMYMKIQSTNNLVFHMKGFSKQAETSERRKGKCLFVKANESVLKFVTACRWQCGVVRWMVLTNPPCTSLDPLLYISWYVGVVGSGSRLPFNFICPFKSDDKQLLLLG